MGRNIWGGKTRMKWFCLQLWRKMWGGITREMMVLFTDGAQAVGRGGHRRGHARPSKKSEEQTKGRKLVKKLFMFQFQVEIVQM